MSDFHFTHEEVQNGGIKYPRKATLRAHHPDGSVAGEVHYFPPKRKGSPVTVDTLPHGDERARGAGSALLDEMERRHPGSRVVYMDELHEKNKPKPGDPNFNPNRDYGLPTDWDTHFPALPDTIHRGMGVRLDKYDAQDIHDPNVAAEDQAKTLRRAIETGGPGGMHWSADEFKSHQFAHRNVTDPRTDIPVVLHARTPTRKDIETRPDVLRNKGVWPHDHSAGDVEVPIRKRRPVTITGMSWLPDVEHPEADENGWLHHTFDEPLVHHAVYSLTPRIPGGTLDEDTTRGRGARHAGRGKPRSNGSPRGSGAGDAAEGAGGVGGEAGGLGAAPAGPRSVEFHPAAAKDLRKLDKPVQKQIGTVIDQLAAGEPTQTHALSGPLKDWYATKASRGHRITHRTTDEGNIHIGHIGLHNYDEAIRRLTKAAGIRMVPPEEYSKYVWPDYGRKTLPQLAKHFTKTTPEYYQGIKDDVAKNGFTTPVLVQQQGGKQVAKSGHHRAAAGYELGLHLPVGDYDSDEDFAATRAPESEWFSQHERPAVAGMPWREAAADYDPEDTSYRMQHRPPGEDGIPIHDLGSGVPEDVYTHPHWYSDMSEPSNQVAHDVIRRVRGKPEAKVRIYRALPAEYAHQGFRPGDWITTSKEYARGHGKQEDPKHDWPVISAVVKAKHLHTDADDFREFGYNGPHKPNASVSFKGGHHQEVSQRADGTIAPVQRRAPSDPNSEMWGHSVVKMSPEDYHHAMATYDRAEVARRVLPHVSDVKWLPKGSEGAYGHTVDDPSDSWHAEQLNQAALNVHHPEGQHEPGTAPLLGVTLHTKNGKTVDRIGLRPHVDYSDLPMGFGAGHEPHYLGRAVKHPSLGQKPKEAARALPTDRIFGPTYGLDHRLFEGEHLKPEVRSAILERLDKILRVDAQLVGSGWQDYIEVYLGGSEASEWTSPTLEGNNDFDTLLGIDYDKLRGHDGRGKSAEWIDKTDSEIDDVFNDVLRTFFNDEDWLAPFGGVYHLTGYVNSRPEAV